jgi:hypothetical protein
MKMTEKKANEILGRISLETDEHNVILHSNSYGDVEAWNLATCYLQNAEIDKVSLVDYMECALAYESQDVQAYFKAFGFSF